MWLATVQIELMQEHLSVRNSSGFYPRLRVHAASRATVSHAGSVLLLKTVRATGLDRLLSMALVPRRKPLARHDPAKVLVDLAVALALGGDWLADVALLRAAPELFGPVASDPTVSRTIDALAADSKALTAIATARAAARAASVEVGRNVGAQRRRRRKPAAGRGPGRDAGWRALGEEGSSATFKRGFGHHLLLAFVDHGPGGMGEPLAMLLRPGNAESNTAADHITVTRAALAQLPGVDPVRRDGGCWSAPMARAPPTSSSTGWSGGGCPHSLGFTLPAGAEQLIAKVPASADHRIRDQHPARRCGQPAARPKAPAPPRLSRSSWNFGSGPLII